MLCRVSCIDAVRQVNVLLALGMARLARGLNARDSLDGPALVFSIGRH